MARSERDEEVLLDLILRWEELRAKGRDVAVEELCREWPSLADELRRRLAILEQTAWLDAPLDDPGEPDGEPICLPGEGDGPDVSNRPQAPSTAALSGQVLAGRYRMDELVAEGGAARVWRATDLELQRTVAVKIPRRLDDEMAGRLVEEAQRVASLVHPGIVPTYDVGRHGDTVFFVSEFIEGGSLADVCRSGAATVEQRVGWIAQIADALAYAHDCGIVHRDIKPANILIDGHGRARLADFGIAQPPDTPGRSLGTLDYASPEQCSGQPVDHRSDIYSLAVVLHACLAGSLPHQPGKPSRQASRAAGSPLPRPLQQICQRALTLDPAERFPSAHAFAQALREVDGTRHRRLLLRLAVALLAVGGVLAALAFNTRSISNALRPQMTVRKLPAWDAAGQSLEQVLTAVASAESPQPVSPPRLDSFAAGLRDYDQQGGGVVAPSGEVYCLPAPDGSMLVINPETKTTRLVRSPLLAGGNYFGGVLAPDGCLYLMPHLATHFIRIDPATDEVTAFGEAADSLGYWGGVVAGNGCIYAIPSTATQVVEIDPATQACVRFGDLSDAHYKYAGGVLAPNGRIYCIPDQARQILVIDPQRRSVDLLAEDLGDDAGKGYGGVLAPNGKIYSGTSATGRVIVLDPRTDAIEFIEDVPADRYIGSVLGADGRIYCVPNKPGEVLVIDPATNTLDVLPGSRITGGYWGAVLTPYGAIVAIPWEANRVLAIDFGRRLPEDWPLSRLFNRY